MTVPSEQSRITYDTDGTSVSFPVPFRFLQNRDLRVTLIAADDSSRLLVLDVDYSVAGAGQQSGGTLSTVDILAAGQTLLIERIVPITQETAYQRNDPFPERAHEQALDKLTMINQQIGGVLGMTPGSVNRALLLGDTDRDDGSGSYRARGNRIRDVGDPVSMNDAVNKQAMTEALAGLATDGSGEFVIERLADGERDDNGAGMIARTVVRLASVAAMIALPSSALALDQTYMTHAYHAGGVSTSAGPIGGSMYVWNPAMSKARHNGGTIIDPARPWPTTWGKNTQTGSWFTPATSGTGCFVRVGDSAPSVDHFGATSVVDDTLPFQAALDSSAEVWLTDGLEYRVSETGPAPDGHAGNYCLIANSPVRICGNEKSAKLIVPANSHGIISNTSHFYSFGYRIHGEGVVGTIGHHIKINGPIATQRVFGMGFSGVSDAAVNCSVALDAVLADWDNPNLDPFDFGPRDVQIFNNEIHDCLGDAAIELQGVTGGLAYGNKFYNAFGHGVRVVGCRDTHVYTNHGEGVGRGVGAFSALVSTYSGAITRAAGDSKPLYNKNVTVIANTGTDCSDGLHFGQGSEGVTAHSNVIGVRNYAIRIHLSGVTGRWGIKDHTITGNTFSGGRAGVLLIMSSASPPQENAPLIVSSTISSNTFNDLLEDGFRADNQGLNNWVEDSNLGGNSFNFKDPGSEASRCVYITRSRRVNYEGNKTNLLSSRDLVLSIHSECALPNMTRYPVVVTMNRFYSSSPRNWQTGKAVRVRSTGTLPTPLSDTKIYYLISDSDQLIRMATTLENAINGVGFSLTSEGSGRHYIVPL